jgi:uncharacterized protein YggE
MLNRWKVAAVMAILVAAVLGVSVVPAMAQSASGSAPVNSVTVSGTGKASGAPDVAYINLGVDTRDADVSKAVEQSNKDIASIMDAVRGAGVDAKDIQTTNFNVYPEDQIDPQTNAPTGKRVYHVQNMLNITVRDISKVGAVIDAGLKAGASSINGLDFGIADTSKLEQDARLKAVDDARRRAEQLAAAFGLKVGDPIIISESFGGIPPMPYYNRDAMGGAGAATQISPGQLSVSVQVDVTFILTK